MSALRCLARGRPRPEGTAAERTWGAPRPLRNLLGSPVQEEVLPIRIHVPDSHAGERLDVLIPRLAAGISRREARRLIEQGSVFVDGRRTRVLSRPVPAGAEIRVETGARPSGPAPAAEILREGEGFVAVQKPSGVPTEPTRMASAGSLLEGVRAALAARGERPAFLAAAHRLDVETSGLVVFATRPEAAGRIGTAFQQGQVARRYLAVVEGALFVGEPASAPSREEAGSPTFWRTFEGAIACRDARQRLYHTDPSGRPARTDVAVAARSDVAALLLVTPHSGRTHQIRVHLSEAGHPVWGDTRYGAAGTGGFGLHALALFLPAAASPRSEEDGRMLIAPPTASFLAAAAAAGFSEDVVMKTASAWAKGQTEGEVAA